MKDTPLMRSWAALTAAQPAGTLVGMHVGDFYEFFADQAKIVAGVLTLAITKRNDLPMTGIPYYALTRWIPLLQAAGHVVKLAEPDHKGWRIPDEKSPEETTVPIVCRTRSRNW